MTDVQLPEGWNWVKLGHACILITKGAFPKWQGFDYLDDETQTLFVTSENVRENFLDLTRPKYLDSGFNQIQKRSILQKNDVLLNIASTGSGS
jgi:type I restriction enzyme, S subunit